MWVRVRWPRSRLGAAGARGAGERKRNWMMRKEGRGERERGRECKKQVGRQEEEGGIITEEKRGNMKR